MLKQNWRFADMIIHLIPLGVVEKDPFNRKGHKVKKL
jgi:hypothetical protein